MSIFDNRSLKNAPLQYNSTFEFSVLHSVKQNIYLNSPSTHIYINYWNLISTAYETHVPPIENKQ